MSSVILENELAKVEISSHAAEVHHFIDKAKGTEAIWCGDAKFWANRNPILFPHTGSLPEKKYVYHGREYTTGNHGFARHAEFTLVGSSTDTAEFVLASSDELKEKSYPFDFELHVVYRLNGNRLTLHYSLINQSEEDLPFEFGLHPAFNVPMDGKGKFQDYKIIFEKAEQSQARTRSGEPFILEGTELRFADDPFGRSKALFFGGLKSDYVTLTDGTCGIRVGIKGTEQTGFWQPDPEAPFVCIEPWHPINQLKKADSFGRGRDNNLLPSKETWEFETYFELL